MGKQVLIQALVRAPVEGAKSAANGDSFGVMMTSAGWGAASSLLAPISGCLTPFMTKQVTNPVGKEAVSAAFGTILDWFSGQGKNETVASISSAACSQADANANPGFLDYILKFAGMDSETKMINECFSLTGR